MSHPRALPWFLLGYGLLIVAGTMLLLLPGSTTATDGLSFLDALFTAVSAACLVGLTVVNTATHFTPAGQIVLLLLIQLGALHYLFFAVRLFRQQGYSNAASEAKETPTRSLLWQVTRTILLVEAGAFLVIYYTAGNYEVGGVGRNLFIAAFHAVSAFCNAGFSLLSENMYSVQRAFVLHVAILATFVLGGLGVDTLYDLFSPKRLRQRLSQPDTDWRTGTKVAVNSSMVLLAVSTLIFYGWEQNNTLLGLNLTEKVVASLFQSATTRTAGFYTVDITQLANATLWFMMVLMFAGGGVGSTAGGIHIATLYYLFTGHQSQRLSGNKRSLPIAGWVVGYALIVNASGVLLLSVVETDRSVISLAFEQISAFSSVGLSHAVTASLSQGGQGVLLLSMLLGRIGILALMMVLVQRRNGEVRA